VLIQRGGRAPTGIAASRVIDTGHPKSWLSGAGTLPDGLRGES
jgi:hypothetical protein